MTWLGSTLFMTLKGVLSFAVMSTIDFLPICKSLLTWKSNITLLVNYALIKKLSSTSSIYLIYSSQGRFTWRHNSILSLILAQLHDISKSATTAIKIYANLSGWTIGGGTISSNVLTTSQHPDLVLVDET